MSKTTDSKNKPLPRKRVFMVVENRVGISRAERNARLDDMTEAFLRCLKTPEGQAVLKRNLELKTRVDKYMRSPSKKALEQFQGALQEMLIRDITTDNSPDPKIVKLFQGNRGRRPKP